MKALLTIGAVLVTAVAIAACGGSSGGAAAKGSNTTGSNTTVSTQNVGGTGTVLVDSSGMALYAPDQEKSGKILCTGACTSIWMPLTVASRKPTGPGNLGTVKRPDGKLQVTAGGRPLYTFVQDQSGQVTGDGARDSFGGHSFTWHVITSKGAPAKSSGSGSGAAKSPSSGGAYGAY